MLWFTVSLPTASDVANRRGSRKRPSREPVMSTTTARGQSPVSIVSTRVLTRSASASIGDATARVFDAQEGAPPDPMLDRERSLKTLGLALLGLARPMPVRVARERDRAVPELRLHPLEL